MSDKDIDPLDETDLALLSLRSIPPIISPTHQRDATVKVNCFSLKMGDWMTGQSANKFKSEMIAS